MIDRCLNDEYPISYEAVDLLCKHYGVSRLYMREGIGQPFPDANKKIKADAKPIEGLPIGKMVFPNVVAFAGDNIGAEGEEAAEVFMLPGISGTMVGFNVSGDSMEPTLNKGDIILCTHVFDSAELKDDEVYVVTQNNDKAIYVKRIERVFNSRGNWTHIRLHSDNKAYESFEILLSDVRGMYKVVRRITAI
jgi:Predicted transcriptional regulator